MSLRSKIESTVSRDMPNIRADFRRANLRNIRNIFLSPFRIFSISRPHAKLVTLIAIPLFTVAIFEYSTISASNSPINLHKIDHTSNTILPDSSILSRNEISPSPIPSIIPMETPSPSISRIIFRKFDTDKSDLFEKSNDSPISTFDLGDVAYQIVNPFENSHIYVTHHINDDFLFDYGVYANPVITETITTDQINSRIPITFMSNGILSSDQYIMLEQSTQSPAKIDFTKIRGVNFTGLATVPEPSLALLFTLMALLLVKFINRR